MKSNTLSITAAICISVLTTHKGFGQEPLSFDYSTIYMDELESFDPSKEEIKFVEKGRIEEISATLINCDSPEGEDFSVIQLELKSGEIVRFENRAIGWINLDHTLYSDPVLPKNIRKTPHGMILDMENGDKILALFGYYFSTSSAPPLTLIYISPDAAEVVFNREFCVREIANTDTGYKIVGDLGIQGGWWAGEPCEIIISNDSIHFQGLSKIKIYEDEEDGIILYNAEAWGCNKSPGDFTVVRALGKDYDPLDYTSLHSYWTPIPDSLKMPEDDPGIKKTPYYLVFNKELVLCMGKSYDGKTPYLTIFRPRRPTNFEDRGWLGYYKHDMKFHLQEIVKTEKGYRLIEAPESAAQQEKPYDILIEGDNVKRDYTPYQKDTSKDTSPSMWARVKQYFSTLMGTNTNASSEASK